MQEKKKSKIKIKVFFCPKNFLKEGGKGAKKEDKKAVKKGGKVEEEVPKEISPAEIDMKHGINLEK